MKIKNMQKISTDKKKIDELLSRGVDEVIMRDHLKKKLLSGKQLRIKLGIDPTSPNLHLGRSMPLLKLRDFQELGHKIVFIVGDFTGVIGDTSDKDAERPMLDEKIVKENLKHYAAQAGNIIDLDKAEVRRNSEWLGKLNYHDVGEHADVFSLSEFIARDNIARRLKAGKRISLRELLYPLMQGYDSVAIKADVEVGGTDQRFNLIAGRHLQEHFGQEAQNIVINPLINGLDGRKMSSSWGNTINMVDAPEDMYGKVMSARDEIIEPYFVFLTRVPRSDINQMAVAMKKGANPRDYKMLLAFEIVRMYHGESAAKKAEEFFVSVFQKKEVVGVQDVKVKKKKGNVVDLLIEVGSVKSKSEGRKVIEQGGVKIDGEVVKGADAVYEVDNKKGFVLQKGKKKAYKILYK
jgi:tyrosyl-tRNA synthetase